MRVAVCDDDKVFRRDIAELLKSYQNDRKTDIFIDFYQNGSELLSAKYAYDIIFMVFQMDGINGIDVCRHLRVNNKDSAIIFISAFPAAAPDAFEVNTFRFLVKHVEKDKLFRALDAYISSIDSDKLLILNTHDGKWRIRTSEILYLEAAGKHTFVHTISDTYEVHNNLKYVEDMLSSEKFCRCHKAFVMGFAHVRNHNNTEILLDNGEKAYIGKRFLRQFKEAFQSYIMRYNKGGMS